MAEISGGDKLEAALARIAAEVDRPATLKVGFMSNATYPDGTYVAMIAAIQNFGTARIPPRPFFSNMVRDKAHEWGPALGALLVANNYSANRSLTALGLGIEGQLRQSIIDTNTPPLAPATLRKRGYYGKPYNPADKTTFGAKPLVDTGHMLGSISSDVTNT